MLQRTTDNVMFSLEPRFVEAFLAGSKRVEIRRRAPALRAGTRVWLYGKLPYGKVMAVGELAEVFFKSANEIWNQFGSETAISKSEFDRYISENNQAAAMIFENVLPLNLPVSLETLRKIEPNFQPPQFFRKIHGGPLLDRLSNS